MYFADETVQLFCGDAAVVLAGMEARSVDACVSSPPYWRLRDYGCDGQIGLEASPEDFVDRLVEVFTQVRRVLKDDGAMWLNLGDTFTHSRNRHRLGVKQLLGLPWRVAFALQESGWVLRSDVIWRRPNAMPESVKDRPTCTSEHVFLLAKSPNYYFDLDAIRVPMISDDESKLSWNRTGGKRHVPGQKPQHRPGRVGVLATDGGKNPGDVWDIPTQPFPGPHFAVMPPQLAKRCVTSICRPGGTVLDPFSGTGTTGLAATDHGCRYIGIDVDRAALELSLTTRLSQGNLL